MCLLTDNEFDAAMDEAVADPTNALTRGPEPDVISADPEVLRAEGGGDDPSACADEHDDGEVGL